ncbi:hypothetical protein BD779DRAFT_278367 [Infundibulicybe gibba]|nr:hypothetical protein BD779DRAFT_278367 [Infundibulicybe gibba]
MAIWESGRIAVGAPECAPGFSERQWASSYSGPNLRDMWHQGCANITFSMRRRVCDICMGRNLVSPANFAMRFPDYDPAIFEMAPNARCRGTQDYCCWASDLERIGKEWKRLEADVDREVRGAEKRSRAYYNKMTGEADRIMKHAAACKEWLSQITRKEARKKQNRRRCAYVIAENVYN